MLQVVFTGVVRKMSECFFTKKELMYIDDLLPGTSLDDHKKTDKSVNQAFFLINLLLLKIWSCSFGGTELALSFPVNFQFPSVVFL